jgi:hypothetical protein
MIELLTKVLDAHGGLERWPKFNEVEAAIVSGGGLFALKGALQDANPRQMTVCAARGAVVRHALWCCRSAHDVHAGPNRDRETRRHGCRRCHKP